MQYPTFHALHIGAAHVRMDLPCQDMCMSVQDARHSIAVVSDGHGNRRHFRSERGAQKACEIAVDCIRDFLNRTENLTDAEREAQIQHLKQEICRLWRDAILKDALLDPWTPEEIEEQKQLLTEEQFALFQTGQTTAYAYGCTLCAVFTADWGWGAIQVGDGCLTVIEADGTYRWPMPESVINCGHLTASLCSNHPMSDFRHVMETGRPIGLMVYSDGIEKTFANQGREIIALLHWVWKNQRFGDENRLQMLTRMLAQLSANSPSGDDVSIAGMIDPDAEDVEPRFDRNLMLQELRTQEAQREELLTTLLYNRRRLAEIQHDENQINAADHIRRILSRREADLNAITLEINNKRAQLDLPPLSLENDPPAGPDISEATDVPPPGQQEQELPESEEAPPHPIEESEPLQTEIPSETQTGQAQTVHTLPVQVNDYPEPLNDLTRHLSDVMNAASKRLKDLLKRM